MRRPFISSSSSQPIMERVVEETSKIPGVMCRWTQFDDRNHFHWIWGQAWGGTDPTLGSFLGTTMWTCAMTPPYEWLGMICIFVRIDMGSGSVDKKYQMIKKGILRWLSFRTVKLWTVVTFDHDNSETWNLEDNNIILFVMKCNDLEIFSRSFS